MLHINVIIEGQKRVGFLRRLLRWGTQDRLVFRANVEGPEYGLETPQAWGPVLQAALAAFDGHVDRLAVTDGEYQLASAFRMTPEQYSKHLEQHPIGFKDVGKPINKKEDIPQVDESGFVAIEEAASSP